MLCDKTWWMIRHSVSPQMLPQTEAWWARKANLDVSMPMETNHCPLQDMVMEKVFMGCLLLLPIGAHRRAEARPASVRGSSCFWAMCNSLHLYRKDTCSWEDRESWCIWERGWVGHICTEWVILSVDSQGPAAYLCPKNMFGSSLDYAPPAFQLDGPREHPLMMGSLGHMVTQLHLVRLLAFLRVW